MKKQYPEELIGLEFDANARPEPEGEWKYIVDDYGVTYGKGNWPFYRSHEGVRHVAGIRLGVSEHFESSLYVLLHAPHKDRVSCDMQVTVGPQGIGYWVGKARVDFYLEGELGFSILQCPECVYKDVEKKSHKILEFLEESRRERDAGKKRPKTAHEEYDEQQRRKAVQA